MEPEIGIVGSWIIKQNSAPHTSNPTIMKIQEK